MSFSKLDLEKIKNKILLSAEIEKKTRLIKKGKDYWCCCPFHEEKTPSFKINDDHGSFYCFGCGVKGDIFTVYTDLYNYSFQDAVSDLANKAGIKLEKTDYQKIQKENIVKKILLATSNWFIKNLHEPEAEICRRYLKERNLSKTTIDKFKLGYSYNTSSTLFNYLKSISFAEKDIIKSNVVKLDKNSKIKDYFFKRLIFPITDERSNIIGFGGRSLDNSNPKYINSPESSFFQKRYLLYNLDDAKNSARKKNNLLICEGYMDVISLHQKGIQSIVSPLGTALTVEQLNLAWKFSNRPTIMFDGDKAGLRAAYKLSLMSLPLIRSNKFLQFITLPMDCDPDSYINSYDFDNFIEILKNPISLVNFIFNQSNASFSLKSADDKIMFDKYLDELVDKINDKKIKYFYKNEFKTLFFEKIKSKGKNNSNKTENLKKIDSSLYDKQLLSFIASYINHRAVRREIKYQLLKYNLLNDEYLNLLREISKAHLINKNDNDLINSLENTNHLKIITKSLKSNIYQLFPYSSSKFDAQEALTEVKESCINLNTRLSNLQKINKSLNSFIDNSTQLKWEELQSINKELLKEQ